MNITARNDFGLLLNEMGLTGKAVEIGVADGNFAKDTLSVWQGLKYYMVDLWARYDGYTDLIERDNLIMQKMFENVKTMFANEPRAELVRMSSLDAAGKFENDFFDFVYIDANHEYDYVVADIKAWFPKVKSGGILAGHDYKEGYGVVQAVDEFIKETGLKLNLTNEENGFWSWWVVIP